MKWYRMVDKIPREGELVLVATGVNVCEGTVSDFFVASREGENGTLGLWSHFSEPIYTYVDDLDYWARLTMPAVTVSESRRDRNVEQI